MKVSVITITRNAKYTIADTVQSVMDQDYGDIEHIIIDGDSEDETVSIAERVGGRDLRIFVGRDTGPYDAMSKGIRAATGDLIGFLNADDFFARRDSIRSLCTCLAGKPDASAVCGDVAIIGSGDQPRVERFYRGRGFARWMINIGLMPPHPAFYARRAAFETVGAFDPSFRVTGDFEWMLRFFQVHNLAYTPCSELIVFMRRGGISQRGLASLKRNSSEIVKALRQHRRGFGPLAVFLRYPFKLAQFRAGWLGGLPVRDYGAAAMLTPTAERVLGA
jgi:glycosyltransferase involved in cell wall biosynthesis